MLCTDERMEGNTFKMSPITSWWGIKISGFQYTRVKLVFLFPLKFAFVIFISILATVSYLNIEFSLKG